MKGLGVTLATLLVGVLVGTGLGVLVERNAAANRDSAAAAGGPKLASATQATSGPVPRRVSLTPLRVDRLELPLEMLGKVAYLPGTTSATALLGDVIVDRVLVRPGQHVDSGAPILAVRPTVTMQSRLTSAEADVDAAREMLEAVQDRVASKLATRTDLLAAQQNLATAELSLAGLRESAPPEDGYLRSATAGVLTSVGAASGAVASAGTTLFEIAPDEALRVRFGIPLAFADDLPLDSELSVFELLSGAHAEGTLKLDRVEHVVDDASRTLTGWTSFAEGLRTRPGTPVRVTARVTTPEAFVVGRSAVVLSDDGPCVFTVRDGAAHRLSVSVLGGNAEEICFTSPELSGGDEVVVLGGYELEDGDVVHPEGRP